MRKELKFGTVLRQRLKAAHETSTGPAVACSLGRTASARPQSGSSNQGSRPETRLSVEARTPINDHYPPITAYLIVTPAIRIAPKSFPCSIGVSSHRHSMGPPNRTNLRNFGTDEIRSISGISRRELQDPSSRDAPPPSIVLRCSVPF